MKAGVALLPVFMAERSGRLVRLPSYTADVVVDIWALVHRDLGQSAHVRALLEFLRAAVQRLAPRLAPASAATRLGQDRAGYVGRRGAPRAAATSLMPAG